MNNEYEEITNTALFDFKKTIAVSLFEKNKYPHEILGKIEQFIKELSQTLTKAEYYNPEPNIYIHWSAKIDNTATILPPAIICKNAEIRKSAYIRGSVIVGENCTIGNSVEIKNSILFDGVQIPHFNYVGDSIFGEKSHMGAGGITSNLKLDKTHVAIKINAETLQTHMRKVGAFVGGNVEIGCNCVLNPGTVIGRNTIIQPLASVRGYIAENSICKMNGEVIKRI